MNATGKIDKKGLRAELSKPANCLRASPKYVFVEDFCRLGFPNWPKG